MYGSVRWLSLASLLLVAACVDSPPEAAGSDESSSEDSTSSTTSTPTTMTVTSASTSTTTTTDTTTTGVTSTTDTTTTDPDTGSSTTSDPDTGSGSSSESTTTGNNACLQTHKITLDGSMATLSGDWVNIMSMVGEGEIAALQGGFDGSVLWEPDIPCDDTWLIWVRYWEDGNDDSYFATLDGQPQPAAIFEGDCTSQGAGYGWRELNWRDGMDPQCVYVEDPWLGIWNTGIHAVELSYRESIAVARIIVINDLGFVPGPND